MAMLGQGKVVGPFPKKKTRDEDQQRNITEEKKRHRQDGVSFITKKRRGAQVVVGHS